MTTSVRPVENEEWTQALAPFADANLYQTDAWARRQYGDGHYERLAIEDEGTTIALALVRIRPLPVLGGVASVYWGPIVCRSEATSTAPAFSKALGALHREFVVQRGLELRITPSLGSTGRVAIPAALETLGIEHRSPTTPAYRTVVLDLDRSAAALHQNLKKKWRYNLTRATRDGVVAEQASTPEGWQAFRAAYAQMRARKDFESNVSVDVYEKIHEDFPEAMRPRIFLGKLADGRIAFACVIVTLGDTAVYLLGATADAGLETTASYVVHWHVIQHLLAQGFARYDLGGIDPEANEHGARFKLGTGGREVTHPGRFDFIATPWKSRAMSIAERLLRR